MDSEEKDLSTESNGNKDGIDVYSLPMFTSERPEGPLADYYVEACEDPDYYYRDMEEEWADTWILKGEYQLEQILHEKKELQKAQWLRGGFGCGTDDRSSSYDIDPEELVNGPIHIKGHKDYLGVKSQEMEWYHSLLFSQSSLIDRRDEKVEFLPKGTTRRTITEDAHLPANKESWIVLDKSGDESRWYAGPPQGDDDSVFVALPLTYLGRGDLVNADLADLNGGIVQIANHDDTDDLLMKAFEHLIGSTLIARDETNGRRLMAMICETALEEIDHYIFTTLTDESSTEGLLDIVTYASTIHGIQWHLAHGDPMDFSDPQCLYDEEMLMDAMVDAPTLWDDVRPHQLNRSSPYSFFLPAAADKTEDERKDLFERYPHVYQAAKMLVERDESYAMIMRSPAQYQVQVQAVEILRASCLAMIKTVEWRPLENTDSAAASLCAIDRYFPFLAEDLIHALPLHQDAANTDNVRHARSALIVFTMSLYQSINKLDMEIDRTFLEGDAFYRPEDRDEEDGPETAEQKTKRLLCEKRIYELLQKRGELIKEIRKRYHESEEYGSVDLFARIMLAFLLHLATDEHKYLIIGKDAESPVRSADFTLPDGTPVSFRSYNTEYSYIYYYPPIHDFLLLLNACVEMTPYIALIPYQKAMEQRYYRLSLSFDSGYIERRPWGVDWSRIQMPLSFQMDSAKETHVEICAAEGTSLTDTTIYHKRTGSEDATNARRTAPERALNARVVSDQLHIGTTLCNPTNPPEHVMVTFMLDRQYLTSFVLWMTLSFSINMVCMLLMHTGHAAQGVPDDRLKIQILQLFDPSNVLAIAALVFTLWLARKITTMQHSVVMHLSSPMDVIMGVAMALNTIMLLVVCYGLNYDNGELISANWNNEEKTIGTIIMIVSSIMFVFSIYALVRWLRSAMRTDGVKHLRILNDDWKVKTDDVMPADLAPFSVDERV